MNKTNIKILVLATIYWGLLILSVSAALYIYSFLTEFMMNILALIAIWIGFYLVVKVMKCREEEEQC